MNREPSAERASGPGHPRGFVLKSGKGRGDARFPCSGTTFVLWGLAWLAGCAALSPDSDADSGVAPGGGDSSVQPGWLDATVGDAIRQDLSWTTPDARPFRSDARSFRPDARSFPSDAAVGWPDRTVAPPRDAEAAAPDGFICPLGEHCNPIVINRFPFVDNRNTDHATSRRFDSYACAPDTDESGPEFIYRVEISEAGTLTAELDDVARDGIDIDIHLLTEARAETCIARDNIRIAAAVGPGHYTLVTDTWTNAAGQALTGWYVLTVDFEPGGGMIHRDCEMEAVDLRMFWPSCGAGMDCYEGPAAGAGDGRLYPHLRTPATGPVVLEAHLVTSAEDFQGGWPSHARDGIDRHYALSQDATGYAMNRRQPWAPAGEGGSSFGQGSTRRPPVVDEAWYVTMYWRDRPDPGTRMIISSPRNGRAVVASAGYESGPGANTAIAGVSEEIHDHLGSGHRDLLTVGFAVDPQLPLGPIECRR